jgi:hypothetical protein
MSWKSSYEGTQSVEIVSSKNPSLQEAALGNKLLNVVATETVPLFEYPEFDFLLEHEFTSYQISFAAFHTVITRTSMAYARLYT